MYTITKRYENLKAAHRQWRHDGHCSKVHGESWAFEITFGAHSLDEQNFVIDFGKMTILRDMLANMFDHTLLIDEDDPARQVFEMLHGTDLADVKFLPSCGAEGLAKLVYHMADNFVRNTVKTDRVFVVSVKCFEDNKNSAVYTP